MLALFVSCIVYVNGCAIGGEAAMGHEQRLRVNLDFRRACCMQLCRRCIYRHRRHHWHSVVASSNLYVNHRRRIPYHFTYIYRWYSGWWASVRSKRSDYSRDFFFFCFLFSVVCRRQLGEADLAVIDKFPCSPWVSGIVLLEWTMANRFVGSMHTLWHDMACGMSGLLLLLLFCVCYTRTQMRAHIRLEFRDLCSFGN